MLAAGVLTTRVNAQQRRPDTTVMEPNGFIEAPNLLPSNVDPKTPHRIVEQMPAFKGDLITYLARNLKYPAEPDLPVGKARTIVQFIVRENGLIRDIELVRSSGYPKCDEAAVRVLQPMVKKVFWTPGRLRDKAVSVFFTLPITFDRK